MEPSNNTKPFNHALHIANTIAKRRCDLIAALTEVELSGASKKIKRQARENAFVQFAADMLEIDTRIRETA